MNSKRRVFWNSLSGVALFVLSLAVAFLLAPVLIHGLGNRDYSVWELVLGFLAYFRILDLGIAPALVRSMSRALEQGDPARVQAVHHSAITGLSLAGGVSILGFAILSLRPEPLLNLEPGALPAARTLFLATGTALGVQFVGISFSAYLQGLQEHYRVNAIRGGVLVLQSAGFYWIATGSFAAPLTSMALVFLGASTLEYGIYAWLVLRRASMRPWRASRPVLQELYVFGLKSFNLMIADRIRKISLPFVITHVMGVSNVVYFSQPSRLIDYALNLTAFLHQPLMPFFSAVSSRGDVEATRRDWFSMSRALQFLLLFVALGIFFLGVPFIHRWLGEEYAREGFWVVKILSLGLVVEALASTSSTMLVSLDRHGKPSLLALLYSLGAVAAAIPLIRSHGVAGAALALAVTNALTTATFLHLTCRHLGTHMGHYLWNTARRFLIPLALTGVGLWWWQQTAPPLTYRAILLQGASAALAYAVLAWVLSLGPRERAAIRGFLKRS